MTATGPAAPSAQDLVAQVRAEVARVADDPEGRYALRRAFYQRFGFGCDEGYGLSELQFLRWEIERGVLNPLTGTPPGSLWWRQVNEALLVHAQCAAALYEAGVSDADVDVATAHWLEYLHRPSPQSWYRAHNASIAAGYLAYPEAARAEAPPEQTFLNVVLYRLLYAQSLVEGDAPGLINLLQRWVIKWLLRDLERIIADPRSPSVDVIVHLPDFYPRHYPLTPQDIRDVLERGHSPGVLVEDVFDKGFILPSLTKLYALAARWLSVPELARLVDNHRPIYPHYTISTSVR
jgi:hypothetical protein